MFKYFKELIVVALLVIIAVSITIPPAFEKLSFSKDRKAELSTQVVQRYDLEEVGDLSVVTGEDILGMILFAKEGEYLIVVDGILINQASDLNYLNLSGVVGKKYNMQIQRDAVSGEVIVIANVAS
jgi:hypothetical protein